MSSISLNSLFQSLEAQVGKEALLAAFAAYSPDAPAAKPKRVGKPLTEEHKAKLAAGRAASKAKKEAAKAAAAEPSAAAAPAAEPPAKEDGDESTSSSQKKKPGRKPKSDMTPDELEAHKRRVAENAAKRKAKKAAEAASVPLPASSDEAEKPDPSVFAESVIKGTKYLRNFRGDLLTAPDAAKAVEGYEWVGRYNGKTIDTTFPKPADLEDDE